MKPANFEGRRQQRHHDAVERQEVRASRTPKQQLQTLDRRLGEGVGAEKERARILKDIAKSS